MFGSCSNGCLLVFSTTVVACQRSAHINNSTFPFIFKENSVTHLGQNPFVGKEASDCSPAMPCSRAWHLQGITFVGPADAHYSASVHNHPRAKVLQNKVA
eukprot:1155240-Pelagomonas_calceolata.AAC.4